MKRVAQVYKAPPRHWVGNGFYVSTMFTYKEVHKNGDPFLLIDYIGPHHFKASADCLGVGPHPHRGLEAASIVYQGQVEHSDSQGTRNLVAPGGVQWMTAGSGVLHQELLSKKFCQKGGVLEMVQLWLNLPKVYKMTPPKYQAISAEQIPTVTIGKSQVRIIAGDLERVVGPVKTFSPISVWDLNLKDSLHLPTPEDHNVLIFVRDGLVALEMWRAGPAQLITFQKGGEGVHLQALRPSSVLVLTGLPLSDPIVGCGPFVMNSKEEIEQAQADLKAGKFGTLRAGHGE
ncbi:quercetin 2,3-dioxygenase [Helicobacter sp. NHP19-012]|uniref:Quercetin 2,3-dioxygenase n=1 Tax=Helicobacter gastrofelis TaxID=2849642 RepID=A0ABM7SD47_9HELI|nr:pirin family protein [Helicobacter sp. NHP19-012]BCZ18643.1 quercetin 2,3-dioxygenase [Helicobacter sp. NHP19-012]